MIKKKPVAFALIYTVLVIAFKLFVFSSGMQMTKLGMYSHILSLLLMTPFILLMVFLIRKERGGGIEGKVALIEGLTFVLVSSILLSIFNYVFFQQELGSYIVNYIQTQGPKSIIEEAAKKGKTITQAEVDKMIKDGVADLSAFKDTTSKLFSMLMFGIFSSFVVSVFLKRSANA
jgi:hypothetical protein